MIILVGPSASGKTELGKLLQKAGIEKLVTYTSREKRIGEIDGIDYHFVSKEYFYELEKRNFFFETVCYHNNCYGTAKSDLNKNAYLIVEPSGLEKYRKEDNTISFYIDVPSQIRKERMSLRGDNLESINKRLSGDSKIFTDDVKNKCDYILDGTKKLEELFIEIKEILTKRGLFKVK